jgi:hypothetical protein
MAMRVAVKSQRGDDVESSSPTGVFTMIFQKSQPVET